MRSCYMVSVARTQSNTTALSKMGLAQVLGKRDEPTHMVVAKGARARVQKRTRWGSASRSQNQCAAQVWVPLRFVQLHVHQSGGKEIDALEVWVASDNSVRAIPLSALWNELHYRPRSVDRVDSGSALIVNDFATSLPRINSHVGRNQLYLSRWLETLHAHGVLLPGANRTATANSEKSRSGHDSDAMRVLRGRVPRGGFKEVLTWVLPRAQLLPTKPLRSALKYTFGTPHQQAMAAGIAQWLARHCATLSGCSDHRATESGQKLLAAMDPMLRGWFARARLARVWHLYSKAINVPYSLCDGTLLGAVRHGNTMAPGYLGRLPAGCGRAGGCGIPQPPKGQNHTFGVIPHDHDMDVVVPRNTTLLKRILSHWRKLPEDIAIHHKLSGNHFGEANPVFARLRDLRSCVFSKIAGESELHGIWVDIWVPSDLARHPPCEEPERTACAPPHPHPDDAERAGELTEVPVFGLNMTVVSLNRTLMHLGQAFGRPQPKTLAEAYHAAKTWWAFQPRAVDEEFVEGAYSCSYRGFELGPFAAHAHAPADEQPGPGAGVHHTTQYVRNRSHWEATFSAEMIDKYFRELGPGNIF